MRPTVFQALLLGCGLAVAVTLPAQAEVRTQFCGMDNGNPVNILPGQDTPPAEPWDLVVNDLCQVTTDSSTNAGTWKFRRVNILANGVLEFVEKNNSRTDFWAHGIVIENGGKMIAGRAAGSATPGTGNGNSESQPVAPVLSQPGRAFGELGGTLTIHLYGADQSNGDPSVPGQGTPCRSMEIGHAANPCGIDDLAWKSDGKKVLMANGIKDYFYPYDALYADSKTDELGRTGYFGYKSIGLSYGGSLELYGAKGALRSAPTAVEDPTSSGNSWMRLGATLVPSYVDQDKKAVTVNVLKLDRAPGTDWPAARWQPGDEIVVTATDYLPNHSEQLTIEKIDGQLVTFRRSDCAPGQTTNACPGVRWRHQGERYPLSKRIDPTRDPKTGQTRLTTDPKLIEEGVETRAAVALLTRSIRIVSEGDSATETFAQATARNASYAFGGHLVVRQGFAKMQVQGVEFKQMGQGGRKGHYPVHFHMARVVPNHSWIKDSSVNESMTRWIVVHSTHNLTIARNVGYLSIGHGFYLEDSTEIDNRFHSNIGIHARAAVDSDQNPRRIPGILVDNTVGGDSFPLLSDGNHPSVFWITNNWNDFIGNAAVGAGTCGACYWVVPSYSVQNDHHSQTWEGYAGLQTSEGTAGTTPLKSFYKNTCSSAMNSFISINHTESCLGVTSPIENEPNALKIIPSKAPSNATDPAYYPRIGDVPHSTHCPVAATQDNPGLPITYDCTGVTTCSNGAENCGVTVLDHYTTSFNWAAHNFAAIWLRQFWYLFDNSAITDVMTAGITFVSGGDYTKSSSPEGYWALARNSVFVGETQPENGYAFSIGPTNTTSGLKCDNAMGNSCVLRNAGISIQKSNWGVNQRFFSIYDGPNYQDSNIYLDITPKDCSTANGCVWADTNTIGVRKDATKTGNAACYAPNAAIAWKQPNGFYYPPAFHSTNLFFDNVGIRHYVIAPLFKPTQPLVGAEPMNFGQGGSYITDFAKADQQYCYFPTDGFNNFTDIDRQTELNDDDGSLTGLNNTISVNEDPFFSAPIETAECKSNINVNPSQACNASPTAGVVPTAKTSPYDYVTTVIIPDCAKSGVCAPDKNPNWSEDCAGPFCYGVPIYRQFLTGSNTGAGTREWKQWIANGCDKDMTTAQCRWPFLRMAGQKTWQRSNLTANYGSYYIDTTVPLATQLNEKFTPEPGQHSVNVFEANKTYSLMFVFAKPSTKQTYRMYVGDVTDISQVEVKTTRGTILAKPTTFTNDDAAKWLTPTIENGLLRLDVDFSKTTDLLPSKANGSCQPHTFCAMDTNSNCACALKDDDPMVLANPGIKASCNRVCGHWAVKDMDCPIGGCYAVGITMGADFVADDVQRRPQPTAFPGPTVMSLAPGSGDRGWETLFSRTTTLPDGKPGGTCYYDKVPGTTECIQPPN